MSYDVIVIGGGAIGLATARELGRDRKVLLLERGALGKESSWAAAGMLCPHSEAAAAEDTLMKLGMASLGMYREFAAELLAETGVDIEYRDDGTLLLGSTPDQWSDLQARSGWLRRAGFEANLLEPREVRQLEPSLTLEIQGALLCPGDHQISPRQLLKALGRACRTRGVELLEKAAIDEVLERRGRVEGVRAESRRFLAPNVIVAAGAWASKIRGLRPQVETGPRKGQILSLRMPGPVFRHIIRWQQYYFVPRRDGSLVVGATNEDAGFDKNLTVSGLAGLLNRAEQMSAGIGNYSVVETWAGLRPFAPDGLPVIGAAEMPGLFYAFGHYRNGILLTPITMRILRALLDGDPLLEAASALSPTRFADESSRV